MLVGVRHSFSVLLGKTDSRGGSQVILALVCLVSISCLARNMLQLHFPFRMLPGQADARCDIGALVHIAGVDCLSGIVFVSLCLIRVLHFLGRIILSEAGLLA